jgi:uncharacterized protein YktB (UPF0637 family)
LNKQKLFEHEDLNYIVSSLDPIYHPEHKVKAMWLSYGRSKEELDKYQAKHKDVMKLQVILKQYDFGIWLVISKENSGKIDREYFHNEIKKEEYRRKFYELLKKLGSEYWVEVAGETRKVDSFNDENSLWEFTNKDIQELDFIIGKNYLPGDAALSKDTIVTTIKTEFEKLIPVYRWMKDKAFE